MADIVKDLTTLNARYSFVSGNTEYAIEFHRQYSSYVRIFYNRLVDNPDFNYDDAVELTKDYYKDNHLMDSYFTNCALQDAQAVYNRFNTERIKRGEQPLGHRLIFGGKLNFENRCKGLLTHEAYREKRLRPVYARGESPCHGNRHFRIRDRRHIDFTVERHVIFTIKLHDRRLKILDTLKKLQDSCSIALTYRLGTNYISITYDKLKVKEHLKQVKVKSNRHLSLDLNPGFIGVTVFDDEGSVKPIDAKVFDLNTILEQHKESKSASDSETSKYFNSKRKFELKEINKAIFGLAEHYQCENIDIENLKFNKLTGRECTAQWNKTLTVNSLESRCKCSGIRLLKVNPAFTSIIGNAVNDYKMPDMCRSALEVGKRASIGLKEGTFKNGIDKQKHLENNFDEVKAFVVKSMEERDCKGIKTFNSLSKFIQTHRIKFRISIDDCKEFEITCNLKSDKSRVKVRTYSDLKTPRISSNAVCSIEETIPNKIQDVLKQQKI